MVSVIMPSYLSPYEGSAINRVEKLARAVDSFLKQTLVEKELIVVSDGCQITNALIYKEYGNKHSVRLVKIDKQPLFSGNVRQRGLEEAKGNIICYLDTDDYLTVSHLATIQHQMTEKNYDWVYYSDWIKIGQEKVVVRNVIPQFGVIGTSSIAHLRSMPVSWVGCDGYGHDWKFIERLKKASNRYDKIYGCGYVVCHIPNRTDY